MACQAIRVFNVMCSANVDSDVSHTLDCRGLRCPMPLLKTKLELNKLHTGQQLKVLATDPHSMDDFAAYAKLSHLRLQVLKHDEEFVYLITK